MAVDKNRSGALRSHLRQPMSSPRTHHDISFRRENWTDLSDACSDSGNECDENSGNVVRWLESLPSDNQWCEAEEQIGRSDTSGTLVAGISSIGDSDVPIALKIQSVASPQSSTQKKNPKHKKYRKGALHADTSKKSTAKMTKKCISIGKNSESSLKTEKIITTGKNVNFTENVDNRCFDASNAARPGVANCAPVFDNPKLEKMLHEAMSRAINKYKRSERTWELPVSGTVAVGAVIPAKRSKVSNF